MTKVFRSATVEPLSTSPSDGDVASGSDLGTRLRQLRRSRGVSLAEVAEGTGISASFLSTVETNSKVVMVTHIDLRRDFRDKAKLDVNLEVSTYSKEPKEKGQGSAAGSATEKGK